jgi:glutathione synthase/RimK-type ligase-like ATP-grasp enzyme
VFQGWDEHAEAACQAIQATGCDALIQPFFDEVLDGELSFVFFDGDFSHCVKKVPAPGDFRVQTEHGGSVERVSPDADLLAQAAAVIAGRDLLYARVDGIVRDGRLHIMELEVIEPELYTRLTDDGADRFADAILRRLT